MRRSLCALAVFFLTSLARAAISVTPEIAIADPNPAPRDGAQRPDAVVTDGTDFLVAWVAPAGLNTAIMRADGQLAGLPRLAIARPEQIRDVSVCWTGAVYLATWGEGASSEDARVVAATLRRDGTLASEPQVVAKPASTQSGALAANGRRALVAYTRVGASLVEVRGALFGVQGALVAAGIPLPISITVTNYADPIPKIAGGDDGFALLWRTGEFVVPPPATASANPPTTVLMHTFHVARVADDGSPIGDSIDFPRTDQTGHDYGIASGGGKYAIAAIEQHLLGVAPGVQPRLQRFIVDPKTSTATQVPSVDTGGFGADVLWNGSRFIAYWMDYTATSLKLMTLPFDAATPVAARSAAHLGFQPRFAFNGRNVFGAWNETIPAKEFTAASERIFAARLDASATALTDAAPTLVSTGWSRQLVPIVATSGRDSLMVWVDERGEDGRVHVLASRIALTGAVIDAKPIELSAPPSMSWPVVVFTGSTYLVAWSEAREAVVRTVGRDGSVGPRISLGAGDISSAAATPSMTMLIRRSSNGAAGFRFSPAGELLDPAPIGITYTYGGALATNGTDFFLVWSDGTDYYNFPSADYVDVLGKRILASGAVDAAPIPIATGPNDQIPRAVASDGRDYLVLYDLIQTGWPLKRALAAKRVLREGQLDGATAMDDGTIIASGTAPSVVAITADRNGFWVAWLDQDLSVYTLKLTHTDSRGNPGEVTSLATFTSDSAPTQISLAQPPQGPLQIVYARRVTDGPYPMTSRAFVRFFGELPDRRERAARH